MAETRLLFGGQSQAQTNPTPRPWRVKKKLAHVCLLGKAGEKNKREENRGEGGFTIPQNKKVNPRKEMFMDYNIYL